MAASADEQEGKADPAGQAKFLGMAIEDAELLAEQSIFTQELGVGARQIDSDTKDDRELRQSGPVEVEGRARAAAGRREREA